MNNKDYILNVPLSILKISLEKKMEGSLRLWLWFKYQFSGKVYVTNNIARRASFDLKISARTFWNYLQILRDNGFLNKSSRCGITFIHGFKSYCRFAGLSEKWRGIVYYREILSVENFKAWLFSTLIYRLIKRQGAHAVIGNKDITSKRAPSVNFLRINYIAKIMKISPSTVSRYKHLAQNLGYLSYRSSYDRIADYVPKPGKYADMPIKCIKGKGAFLRRPDVYAINPFKIGLKK